MTAPTPAPAHDSIRSIVADVQSQRVSARCVTEDALARAAADDLNAMREIDAETAFRCADTVDERVRAGDEPLTLAGVPFAIKDNIVTAFGTTTASSRILDGYRSPFTATAVQRLLDAGAVPIGKTTCDEFAMGSSSEHCVSGVVRNPRDRERVPGGSSGGSAAAVAAGIVPLALGSDTGGSIRQPASFCGVVGLKPSYGRISRRGLIAFGSSLDQIGPVTHSVADAALALQIMHGHDPGDSTSVDLHTPDLTARLDEPIHDLRIGVPREYFTDRNDPDVTRAVETALDAFRADGAQIVEIDLPLTEYGIATYYVIATAEASSNLARYDGIRYGHRAELSAGEDLADLYARSRSEGFGAEVKRRIMLGTYVLSAGYYDAYYKRALQTRRLIHEEFETAFAQCHAIIGPTSPAPAFPIGTHADPIAMYQCDVYTVNTNIAGLPAISIPCGESGGGLPIGLQIQCRAYDDETLLRIAHRFESRGH